MGCGWEATQSSVPQGLEDDNEAAKTQGPAGLAAKDKKQWEGKWKQKRQDSLCGWGMGFEQISENVKNNRSQFSTCQRRYV